MSKFFLRMVIALVASWVGFAGPSAAATVEFTGQTVKYVFDTGSDTLDGYLGLFGSASILPGTDTLRFLPDGWTAEAKFSAAPVDSANDTLNFRVVSLDNNTVINAVSLSGGGDYRKDGGYVNATGQLRVNSTDIAGITAGDFSTIGLDQTTSWTEQASLGGYNANSLGLTVENLLLANIVTLNNGQVDYTGTYAFIEKKFLDISTATSVVPLPAAVWLMLSGLAGLGFTVRKARS